MFEVLFSDAALADLDRLLDFLVDRAETPEDLDAAELAICSIETTAHHQLASTPYSFRKAGRRSTRRELIIPLGATGYIALYEIVSPTLIVVLAVRHQREEDYH